MKAWCCTLTVITKGVAVSEQSPVDYKRQLGAAIQRLRLEHGESRADVAAVLECSEDKVGTIERGEVSMKTHELRAILDHWDVTGEFRADLEHLATESRKRRAWGAAIPPRLRKFFLTQENAIEIASYKPELFHGLAQTPAYARALFEAIPSHSPADVEQLVRTRIASQARLASATPPLLSLIIPEAVLYVPIGGRAVMSEQLRHVRKLATRPNITIRVIRTSVGAHVGSGAGPFTIMTPAGGLRKSVYIETIMPGLFVDETDRVAQFESVFEQMGDVALSPEETLKLLDTVSMQLVTTERGGINHDPNEGSGVA